MCVIATLGVSGAVVTHHCRLTQFLAELLRDCGVMHVLTFDPLNGFSIPLTSGLDIEQERQFFTEHFELNWNEQGPCDGNGR